MSKPTNEPKFPGWIYLAFLIVLAVLYYFNFSAK